MHFFILFDPAHGCFETTLPNIAGFRYQTGNKGPILISFGASKQRIKH